MVDLQQAENSAETSATPAVATLPPEALIIVPVRNIVRFPGAVIPITVGRASSILAARQAVREQRQIGVLPRQDPLVIDPTTADLHRIGTIANIARHVTTPDRGHRLACQGAQRFEILEFLPGWPFLVASFRLIAEVDAAPVSAEIEARFVFLKGQAMEALRLLPQAPPELLAAIQSVESPTTLADMAANCMDAGLDEKQGILETIDLGARLDKVSRILAHRIEVMRVTQDIGRDTRASIDARNREMLLREQMAAIQRQLGEGDEGKTSEMKELGEAIAKAAMPKEVDDQARKELRRLERMPESAPEYGMIRTYLDWLTALPWSLPAETPIDIAAARRVLDEDHFGLEKIKRRIVEHLAARKLAPDGKSPILCFVGPPGVRKTSLGKSIARAMDRPFHRVSLGGVHDEAEIRGHRRTYIGALPGNVIQGIRKAGARNCVMMLDEIDKLGSGVHGDPASALLEVLDPEQNNSFRDNYLAVPLDLGRVVFITTANMLDTIPGPLRDRVEIISLAGHTAAEKFEIGRRYLVARRREANGLSAEQVELTDEAPRDIIAFYTREAGVRNLEREIGKTLRHFAVRIAEGEAGPITIGAGDLAPVLGAPIFENEVAMRASVPRVATGLAWTPVGGDILFIEATGNPGAGVAMFMALASLLTRRNVRNDTAMTGEISLRGLVPPVGGVKEKVIAAQRAGIQRIMPPARNRRDLDDIPMETRERLEFVWLERVEDAVAAGLERVATVEDAPPPLFAPEPTEAAA